MAAAASKSGGLGSTDHGKPSPHKWLDVQRYQEMLQSPLLRALILAQGLAFLLAVMGTTSGLLVARGINMPTTQSFLNYLLLAITCGALHLRSAGFSLRNPWYVYPLLALMDVEANYLVTKAYQYTSITSVTLLDCFTIPAVMALSWLVFRARYLPSHFLGALLCIGGLTLLVLTDGASSTGGPNPVVGDALVLVGACVYAACNVVSERLLVGKTSMPELLAMVGAWGCAIGGVQAFVLERGAWAAAHWSPSVIAPMLGFASSLYLFSIGLPRVLLLANATVLNLSLLTSDLWSAASRVAFFGGFGGTAGWFAGSLVLEAAGLWIYTRAGQTHEHELAAAAAAEAEARAAAAAAAGGGVRQPGDEEEADERAALLPPPLASVAGSAAMDSGGGRPKGGGTALQQQRGGYFSLATGEEEDGGQSFSSAGSGGGSRGVVSQGRASADEIELGVDASWVHGHGHGHGHGHSQHPSHGGGGSSRLGRLPPELPQQ